MAETQVCCECGKALDGPGIPWADGSDLVCCESCDRAQPKGVECVQCGRWMPRKGNGHACPRCDEGRYSTILDAMADAGLDSDSMDTLPGDLAEALDGFFEWDIESHCGKACKAILDGARLELEYTADAQRPALWARLVREMAIICLG